MRKIICIDLSQATATRLMIVLCDDGTFWTLNAKCKWEKCEMPPIPQDEDND